MHACRCSLQTGASLGLTSQHSKWHQKSFAGLPKPVKSEAVGRSAFLGAPAAKHGQFSNDMQAPRQAQVGKVSEARKGELNRKVSAQMQDRDLRMQYFK